MLFHFFESQNMLFRFFALNCWQLTSFCNIHRLENPKAKGIVWFQIYFCLKNARMEISPKRFSKFITARRPTMENFSRRPTMDYEKCAFPVLCILKSLPANKLPPKGLPLWFCITIPKLVNCLLAEMCRGHFPLEGGGVF